LKWGASERVRAEYSHGGCYWWVYSLSDCGADSFSGYGLVADAVTPREQLTEYWNFYQRNSHIENQPEIVDILKLAMDAVDKQQAAISEARGIMENPIDTVDHKLMLKECERWLKKWKDLECWCDDDPCTCEELIK